MEAPTEEKHCKALWRKAVVLCELVPKEVEKICCLFLSALQVLWCHLGIPVSDIHDEKEEQIGENIKAVLAWQKWRDFNKIPTTSYEIYGPSNLEAKEQNVINGDSATIKVDVFGRVPPEIHNEVFDLLFIRDFERLVCLGKYNLPLFGLHGVYQRDNSFLWSAADVYQQTKSFLWSAANVKKDVMNNIAFSETQHSKAAVKVDYYHSKDIPSMADGSKPADLLERSISNAKEECVNSKVPKAENENTEEDDSLPVETQACNTINSTCEEEECSCPWQCHLQPFKRTVSTRVMRSLLYVKNKWESVHIYLRSLKMCRRRPVFSGAGRCQKISFKGKSCWTAGLFKIGVLYMFLRAATADIVLGNRGSNVRPIYVSVNENVTLICPGNAYDRKAWKSNNIGAPLYHYKQGFKNNPFFTVKDNGSAIEFKSVQLSDAGEYYCLSYPRNESLDITEIAYSLHVITETELALNVSEVTSKDGPGFSTAAIIAVVVVLIVACSSVLSFCLWKKFKNSELKELKDQPNADSSESSANTGHTCNGRQSAEMKQLLLSEQPNSISAEQRQNDGSSAMPLQGNGDVQV